MTNWDTLTRKNSCLDKHTCGDCGYVVFASAVPPQCPKCEPVKTYSPLSEIAV